MRNGNSRVGRLGSAAIVVAAIGAPALMAGTAHALYEQCESLGSTLTDHACFHAQFGPYQTVMGASGSGSAPNINVVHTQYTVNLTAGAGAVTYRPARSGDWAMLVEPGVEVAVLDPSGAEVPLLLTDDATGCAQLPVARVYNLVANAVYRLQFGPSSLGSVDVVMENLGDFESFYYADADGDGFGDSSDELVTACDPPAGHVAADADCDDASATVNPGASETANGVDDDCDGEVDEGTAPVLTFYRDADGDGFGNPADSQQGTSAPAGFVDNDDDCDDASATVNPGASETANGVDDDCDGEVDEGTAPVLTFYRDADGDGFGNPADSQQGTSIPAGFVMNDQDCDDANAAVNPDASETANGIDDDCDGEVDDGGGSSLTFYRDADGDGYGDPNEGEQAPSAPEGYVENDEDCNDADAAINPDAEEVCDDVDNDCNGTVDDLEDELAGLVEHACLHAQHGPYETIESGYDLSVPHTAYTVLLEGDGATHTGRANFEAFEAGELAVLLGADVPVRVVSEAGVPVDAERSAPTAGCDALSRVHVFALEAGWYTLELGPTADSSVMVVLESVHHDDHGHEHPTLYADADGDGFGDPHHPLTGCGEEGGVDNADDCDDSAADVNPDAEEICDEVDNDCDGTVDTVDEVSVCSGSCGPIALSARQSYRPRSMQEGEVELGQPVAIQVPRSLPIQSGCALTQPATLRFELGDGGQVKCDYLGIGKQYRLLRCTQRVRGGATLQASKVSLSVRGFPLCGPTEVHVELAGEACE